MEFIKKNLPMEERYARVCDVTGKGMNEGFCFGDGVFYCKSEEDALKEVIKDGYSSLEEAYEDDYYYYTEWDVSDETEYYDSEGNQYEVEHFETESPQDIPVKELQAKILERMGEGMYYFLVYGQDDNIFMMNDPEKIDWQSVAFDLKFSRGKVAVFEYDISQGAEEFANALNGLYNICLGEEDIKGLLQYSARVELS